MFRFITDVESTLEEVGPEISFVVVLAKLQLKRRHHKLVSGGFVSLLSGYHMASES